MTTLRRSPRKRRLSETSSESTSNFQISEAEGNKLSTEEKESSGNRESNCSDFHQAKSKIFHNDSESDDEVEFLFTNPPKSHQHNTKGGIEKETQAVSPTPLSSTVEFLRAFQPNYDTSRVQHDTNKSTRDGLSCCITSKSKPFPSLHCPRAELLSALPISSFPHGSSAYLQSLAEICDTILWDTRWRVGGQNRRLFSWEQGDDLSAIHTLSRRYHKITLKDNQRLHEGMPKTNALSTLGNRRAEETEKDADKEPLNAKYDEQPVGAKSCDHDDRCLETFSRLYFRKGPWFRLDNVYTSYYLPKKPNRQQSISNNPEHQTVAKKLLSPSKFFRRRFASASKSNQTPQPKTNTVEIKDEKYIDQEFVNLQLEAIEVLLGDIQRLLRMGLVRSFHSEEECGKIVGKQRGKYDYGATSVLRQDEQRTVLSKLGAGRTQRTGRTKSNDAYTPSSSTTKTRKGPSDNWIWKQMSQQQTITHIFDKYGRSKPKVLPVIKHVQTVIVEKWASVIVLKASKVDCIPSSALRSATKAVSDELIELLKEAELLTPATMSLCVRLREAPLRTLQRVCRLYLCATSGPGDMRNTGTNAWRSLPDSHTKDFRHIPLRTNTVAPPGSAWNTICYPGKDWRLRVMNYHFINAYSPIVGDEALDVVEPNEGDNTMEGKTKCAESATCGNSHSDVQVFESVSAFHQWELGVELRENCDFLLELNDLVLYEERKRAREQKSGSGDIPEDNEAHDYCEKECNLSCDSSSVDGDALEEESRVDFQNLLTIAGRGAIIKGLLGRDRNDVSEILLVVEQDVSVILGVPLCDRPLSTLVGDHDSEARLSHHVEPTRLENEFEKILAIIAIILTHTIEYQKRAYDPTTPRVTSNRPWLRHMYWEGCMSYVLWDVIPVLEKRGYYSYAISALEVLLFGKRLPRTIKKVVPDCFGDNSRKSLLEALFRSHRPLLSRRARGKAIDRLIIDYTHLVRRTSNIADGKQLKNSTVTKGRGSSKSRKSSSKSAVTEIVNFFTEPIIRTGVVTGQITFCSIRTLAKRLKRPLSLTLKNVKSFESGELGHRLAKDGEIEYDSTKYSDWAPVTDTAVANALDTDRNSVGGRCAFVGFEEDEHAIRMGSVNVEELAKEYYRQGKLPISNGSMPTSGGWHGYHDEGGKIRILFRILASGTLGMDWNSESAPIPAIPTIHLTPYQGAPFDLHVGAESVNPGGCRQGGIYTIRKSSIENFLHNLAKLDNEGVSNFVYDCIEKRVQYTNALQRLDHSLESDLKQVRTLSMLAAGFGGKMLASMFRCLFFDYRHYSGGLPDLLLVRALYTSPQKTSATNGNDVEELVDLGDWVGEEFSAEHQDAIRAKEIAGIFVDTDGDFLGCSKVGDSGGRPGTRFQRSGRARNVANMPFDKQLQDNHEVAMAPYSMPERLSLCHTSRKIKVECMFVEVKSQNDRLDSRQEDWLNILDQYGNARVCKFTKAPKVDKANN